MPHLEIFGKTTISVVHKSVNAFKVARSVASDKTLKGNDDSFMIINIDALFNRFQLWKSKLPMVEPFYAVKTNSDEAIVRTLAALGAGFDCASKAEIEMVTRMGVSPDRIIYANPCKSSSFIAYALAKGVTTMTFDSEEELVKFKSHHTRPSLILRFAVSDPTADNPMSGKYGADPIEEAPELLRSAFDMGLTVVGVSFHIGTGCNDPSAYRVALRYARSLIDIGRQLGHRMSTVDIGGGFTGGRQFAPFDETAAEIRSAIDDFFPDLDVSIIAEPGRFFAARPCTLVTNVIARKAVKVKQGPNTQLRMNYYINDGVCGSFNLLLFGKTCPLGRPLFNKEGECYPSTIWGGTCDAQDVLEANVIMRKLNVGDWLMFEEMGAYTTSASTTFNGFARPTPIYVISERVWSELGK